MILDAGRNSYPLDSVGMIQSIVINPHEPAHALLLDQVSIWEINNFRSKARVSGHDARGFPTYWAVTPRLDRLEIFPVPNRDYEAEIKFYPPLEEM